MWCPLIKGECAGDVCALYVDKECAIKVIAKNLTRMAKTSEKCHMCKGKLKDGTKKSKN